ncbi:MAG: energy-coupling factor transporter transmembrane protein EcfT, partial [Coriobacteriia bacterium]|nr:energy-coupling factor transporter transmembrane protein EcfT [Coriobacteriia bacterium]
LALRMLVPLVAILAFTLVANAFGSDIVSIRPPDLLPWIELHPESMVYFFSPLIGGFGFRLYGLLRGLFLVLRIVLMVMATSLLTYTSQMVALSEAFVSMLRPLAVFKVPIEDIAMVFSITLRFIMLTASETERMMVAQQARGAVFDQGGPIKRGQAWIPVLIPLFVKLFRRADNLAAAMETRCYRGHGRTHLRTNKLKPQVLIAALIASALLIAVGIVL